VVVVKGTFAVLPDGTTQPAPEQVPVLLFPIYEGQPGLSSLRYEADLVLTKPTSDVLLLGHAYPPRKGPAQEFPVGFRVASLEKTLLVSLDGAGTQRVPLEGAVGFGPIPRHKPPRVELGGTYDARWKQERFPLLPLDFDERFFQCAPPDQQTLEPLKGGELIELVNFTPDGYLKFSLPKVKLAFYTDFGDDVVEHGASLHTVIIEPDQRRLQVVWHTALECHPRVHKLKATLVEETAA
jgi:hypothetical protein